MLYAHPAWRKTRRNFIQEHTMKTRNIGIWIIAALAALYVGGLHRRGDWHRN